jgi:hypothetical protein
MKKKAVPEDLREKKREYIHMLEMDHQAFVNRRVSKQVLDGGLPKKKIRPPDVKDHGTCCFFFKKCSSSKAAKEKGPKAKGLEESKQK